MTADTLREQVQSHLDAARAAAAQDAFVDLATAQSIAGVLFELLNDLHKMSAHDRSQVQQACAHFCETDDEEPDFASVVGFDDDLEALNRCLDRIGRPELKVDP